MVEKILNTRIQFKYDSYENWKINNPVLKRGEVAITTVSSNQDGVINAPSLLMKVGDGVKHYNDLQFLSGNAADVAPWAKATEKPIYTASEIAGLADIKSELIGEDTDTVDSNTIKGAKKYADNLNSEIDTRMDAAEASIVTLTGADTVEGSIAKALKDAKDYADTKVDSITGGDAGEI